MTSVVAQSDFDLFYEAHFGDTVAMTYGFTADLGEAQDIAQEAFCRAWLRWREVSTYDNPVAWVRRVATNLAHSRWRRLRVAATHLVRQREPEPMPAVNPDHVAVVAALRKLPATQRRAVVLHHLMDLPVAEVAEQLEVPVGTVKSWLHRARTSLADDLRVDVRSAVTTPPSQEVVDRAGKRQRARIATAASAMVLVLLGGLVGMRLIRVDHAPPPPLGSPTPALPMPSPTPAPDPMASVQWGAATIAFDHPRPGCPTGPVTFAYDGSDWVVGPTRSWPNAQFRPADIVVSDLTGDGRAEATLTVTCSMSEESDDRVPMVLVVERRDDGLHSLGWVGRESSTIIDTWVAGDVLYVDTRPHESSQKWEYQLGRVDGWRWNGAGFGPVNTTFEYPTIRRLNMSRVAGQLSCAAKLTRNPPVAGVSDQELYTTDGGNYHWQLATFGYEPVFAEFGRTGRPYLILPVACARSISLVVFDRVDDEWTAVAALAAPEGTSYHLFGISPTTVAVTPKLGGDVVKAVEYELANGGLVTAARPPSSAPTASPSGAAGKPR